MKLHVDSDGGKERLSWTGPLEIVLSTLPLFAGEEPRPAGHTVTAIMTSLMSFSLWVLLLPAESQQSKCP